MVLRRKIALCLFSLICFLVLAATSAAGQSNEKTARRVEKALEKTWPGIKLLPEAVEIKEAAREAKGLQGKLFSLSSDSCFTGLLLLASSKGRYEYFDYMVLYDTLFRILDIEILVYRSDHGYEIMNKGWLKGFFGQTGCGLQYGKEIDAISGATFSADSITRDLAGWCQLLESIRDVILE